MQLLSTVRHHYFRVNRYTFFGASPKTSPPLLPVFCIYYAVHSSLIFLTFPTELIYSVLPFSALAAGICTLF